MNSIAPEQEVVIAVLDIVHQKISGVVHAPTHVMRKNLKNIVITHIIRMK